MKRLSFALTILILAGCAQRVDSGLPGDPGNDEYRPSIDVNVPDVAPTLDTGNGQDGDLTVTSDVVVNVCVEVVLGSGTSLVVSDASGIDIGRRLLVMQAQDDFATAGAVSLVTEAGKAGAWEIQRVTAKDTTSLTLENALKNEYVSAGTVRAQACTVPEYVNVTINAGAYILAEPWNGISGGVVAFYAQGTVTVGGGIDADFAGFRGGQIFGNSGTDNIEVETLPAANIENGGGKGEGLDGRAWELSGRGAMGNGAGGGNGHNAGGGGGGNGGAGGMGGKQSIDHGDNPNTRGRFGGAVELANEYALIFGGGGGAGQQDDGDSGIGGNGGGAIFLSVNELAGAGSISSIGERGFDGGTNGSGEAGGGGGAGGTILVRTLVDSYDGEVVAYGGQGGDHVSNSGNHGCGGGGGGGLIQMGGFDAATDVLGGASGVNTQEQNDPWDATAGNDGLVVKLP